MKLLLVFIIASVCSDSVYGFQFLDWFNDFANNIASKLDNFRSFETTEGNCPISDIQPVLDVNVSRITGKWFTVLRSNLTNYESDYKCPIIEIWFDENNRLVINESEVRISDNAIVNTTRTVQFFKGEFHGLKYNNTELIFKILDVNYDLNDGYMMLYACYETQHKGKTYRTEKMWVLSRQKYISFRAVIVFHKLLITNKIYLRARLYKPVQENC